MAEVQEQMVSEIVEPGPAGLRWTLSAALPLLLLGVIFAGPLYRVWYRWTDPEDYFTHGPLVPFVSAFLVLRKRKQLTGENPPDTGVLYKAGIGAGVLYFVFSEFNLDKRWLFAVLCAASAAYLVSCLRNLKPEPWAPGLFVLVPALVLCVVAGTHEIVSIGWFFSLVVVVGLVLYYLGKRIALIVAFPLLFLFTAVPLPEYKVQELTMPLKKFATDNTVRILRSDLVGIYCEQQGAKIIFPSETEGGELTKEVTVGAVCSGLRSLIALISFGLLFAYVTPVSRVKKAILFLAVIPASFVANLIRILAIALVTYAWDAEIATKGKLWDLMESGVLADVVPRLRKISYQPVHDFTGIMIFVVAFFALFALERVLTRIEYQQKGGCGTVEPASAVCPEGSDG